MDFTKSRHAGFLLCFQHLPPSPLTSGIVALVISTTACCQKCLQQVQELSGLKCVLLLKHILSLFTFIFLCHILICLEYTAMLSVLCQLYCRDRLSTFFLLLMTPQDAITSLQSKTSHRFFHVLLNSSTRLEHFMDLKSIY